MQEIRLEDINLLDIGNSIQISGTIWSGKGMSFITPGPNSTETFDNIKLMKLTLSEWEKLIKQADNVEVEMFKQDPTGKVIKTIYRKSQRQIDSVIQWRVFQRDKYTCLYCGRTGIPLTVDHILLWEKGGPTTIKNLVSACRACNKDRGNMEYDEWIESAIYKKKSINLNKEQQQANINRILDLIEIAKDLRVSERGR